MRSTYSGATVRLYALSDSDPVAVTLFYGPLAEAITMARQQPDSVRNPTACKTHYGWPPTTT